METMQEGGGHLQNGKVTRERTTEMDPYRELELYLAKVKVGLYIFLSLV